MNIHYFSKALYIKRYCQLVIYCDGGTRTLTMLNVPSVNYAQGVLSDMGLESIPLEIEDSKGIG